MVKSQDKSFQSASERSFLVPRHGSELETARPSTLWIEEVSKDNGCQPQSKQNPSIPRHGAALETARPSTLRAWCGAGNGTHSATPRQGAALVTARPSMWRVWCGAGNGTHREGGSAPPSPPTERDLRRTWRAAGTPVGSLLQRGSPSPPPKWTKKPAKAEKRKQTKPKRKKEHATRKYKSETTRRKTQLHPRGAVRDQLSQRGRKDQKTAWQKGYWKKQGQAEAEAVQDHQQDSWCKPEGTGNHNNKGRKEDHRDKDKNNKGKELYDHGGFKDQRSKKGTYNKQHYYQRAFGSVTVGHRNYNNKQHKNKYYECESGVANFGGFYRSVSVVSRWPFNSSVCVVLRFFCAVLALVLHTLWWVVVLRRGAQVVGVVRTHPYAQPLCTPSWETWTRHHNKNSKTKNPWHGFRKNQRSTRSTNKRPKRKLGPLRKIPGGTQAHIGKDQAGIYKSTFEDQAKTRHTLVQTRLHPGTLWLRPGKAAAHFGKRPGRAAAHFGKDQAETRHTLEKTKRSLAQAAKNQAELGTRRTRPNGVWHTLEVWHTLANIKRSLAHFGKDQTKFGIRRIPGGDQVQYGEDQTKFGTRRTRPNEVWHILEKAKRSSAHFGEVHTWFGTLWKMPNEVWHTLEKTKRSLAHEEAQVEPGHTVEKTKRILAHSGKRAKWAQQQNGYMSVQGTCRTMVYTQYMHSGRGVPSCGMAVRPRGLPQRRRKPQPSNNLKTQHSPARTWHRC
jgi:hypothetical protein